jgi:tripartite-type tricarboxylate transporter receptor subunit TctC
VADHSFVVQAIRLALRQTAGFEVVGFFGVLAPAAAPRDIVARLNGDILKLLARRDITERFASQALEPGNLKPEQFTDYIKREVTKWSKLIREAGITAQ